MKKLNASLSVVLLCVTSVGCAAETDADTEDPSVLGSNLEADSLALKKGELLALGDSIAFGYNPFGDFTKENKFKGYPEALKDDFKVTNSSCPGETSGSFLSATAPDNGCRSYRASYPLHVSYGSSTTQMQFALAAITAPTPKDRPTQITLNVSGNDIFLLQGQCATTANPATCFSDGAPALIGQVATNVATILGTLRGAGYTGPITYMNLYATDYTDANAVGFVNALNSNVSGAARMFGAKIADAFGAFHTAAGSQSPCAAGLLIRKPTTASTQIECDVHPTQEGHEVLAQSVRDAQ
jgi:lysophospholipase L1-like esterase